MANQPGDEANEARQAREPGEANEARQARREAELLDALDAGLLALVQSAPHGTPAQLASAAELAFELALHAADPPAGRAELLGLACALERCLELIALGLVDAGVALPALAMASHTARAPSSSAWAAARYELETLLPVPGGAPPPRRMLDVPAASLVRRAPAVAAASAAARLETLAATWPEPARQAVAAARRRLRGDS